MMKKYLWLLLILIACPSWAAQQTVTLPPDYKVRDRATKYNANFTELYRLAHDPYSSLQKYNDGDVVTSGHVLYVSLQDNNIGHPVTDPAWWQEVQTGDGPAPVDSVFGRTGAVTAQAGDYSAYYLALATCSTVGEVPTWNGSAFTCSIPSGSGDMLLGTAQTITANKTYSDAAAAVFGTDGDWNISSSTAGKLDVASNSVADTTIDIINSGSGSVNMTLHGKFTADAYASPQTSSGPQFTVFREDADNGTNYVGWGSQASNNNDLVLLLPTTYPTANQVLQFAAPSPVTFSDGVTRDASIGSWTTVSGGSSLYVATPPTYSDEACTPGSYSFDTNYIYDCVSSGDWNRVATTDWNNPAPTTYTLTVTDPGNGDSITCSDSDLSAAINCGNGNSDCSATASSGANITDMTAHPAASRQFNNWTGDITGSENPTTTALVMDSNKSVGAAFSAASSCNTVAYERTTWNFANMYVGRNTADQHIQGGWNEGPAISNVCKVEFYIETAGDPSTRRWNVAVYTGTSDPLNDNLGALVGTSDDCTGVPSTDATKAWITCEFPTSLNVDQYSFVVLQSADDTTDANNYLKIHFNYDAVNAPELRRFGGDAGDDVAQIQSGPIDLRLFQ